MAAEIGFVLLGFVGGSMLGAIPFGVILVRVLRGRNLLETGSGGIGMTSVLREAGWAVAMATWWLDMAKGAAAVATFACVDALPEYGALPAAVGAIVGHNWSVFIGLRGGEGASVVMGAMLWFAPPVMVSMFFVYGLFALLWKLRIPPFYRWHVFNWQFIFCLGPLLLWVWGDWGVPDWNGLGFDTAMRLSVAVALTSLIKQAATHGVGYLFRPADFKHRFKVGERVPGTRDPEIDDY